MNKTNGKNVDFFNKIHEKVHSKYEKMQKRIDGLKEDDKIDVTQENSSIKNNSENPLTDSDNIINTDKDFFSVEENINVQDALFEDSADNILYSYIEEESVVDEEEENNLILPKSKDIVEDKKSIVKTDKLIKEKSRRKISLGLKRRKSNISLFSHKGRISRKNENIVLSNTKIKDFSNKKEKAVKTSTLFVALVHANGLEQDSSKIYNLYYCKFKIGQEKIKSKMVRCKSGKITWLEMFQLQIFDDFLLKVTFLENKENFLGNCQIDLCELEYDKTFKKEINLDNSDNISLFMILSMSGTNQINMLTSVDDYYDRNKKIKKMSTNYKWYNALNSDKSVGYLSVIVYGAKGLSAHDTYCVLQLDNNRVNTHTEYKTNNPNWMKIFSFRIYDITSILEVIVYDEKKYLKIGKITIPLLNINGQCKWYALKDGTMRSRAKGNDPRICLEMTMKWSTIKSSCRVIGAKEQQFIRKQIVFNRHEFAKNIYRIQAVFKCVSDIVKTIKTCFEWESMQSNYISLGIWLIFCWFFKLWMIPVLFVIPFLWYGVFYKEPLEERLKRLKDLEDPNAEIKAEKSLVKKFQNLQELVLVAQKGTGNLASFGESIKNLFNFTVPYLSYLAIFYLCILTSIMFFVPTKYIFMAWGINKLTRKIRKPNRIPNNEILDLIGRVPDDEILLDCEEIPILTPETNVL